MSTGSELPANDENDPWEELAEHRETLEMCIEEDTAFADHARRLLTELEEKGYGR